MAPAFVPVTSELIERLQVSLQVHVSDAAKYQVINDTVTDTFGLIFALTQFVTPLISATLYTNYGARTMFGIVGITCFVYATILMIFNCGRSFREENAEF